MFETEFFRKQIYCIKESTCDIVGIFRRLLQPFDDQGIAPPLPLLVTLLGGTLRMRKTFAP